MQSTVTLTLTDLKAMVVSGEVKAVEWLGKTYRLFVKDDVLYRYKPKSSRYGYSFYPTDIMLSQFKLIKNRVVDADKKTYNKIAKFRKLAEQASFTNKFIKTCLELPKTFEQWVNEGKKDLYGYRVTCGCQNDGDVITVKSLSKLFSRLPELIKERSNYTSLRLPFRGYEATIYLKREENGDYHGSLSMEYKNFLNGHYYALINDNTFIYIEKD